MDSRTEMKMAEEDNQIFKPHTWRKVWVRPYESIFSVVMNFSRVNVLDLHQALPKLCKVKVADKYDNLNVGYRRVDKNQMNIVEELLLPEAYIHGLGNISVGEGAFLSQFEKNLKFCPVCMKENGYHSTIYQLMDLDYCPIHNVKLVVSDSTRYHPNEYVTYFPNSKGLSLSEIPLPTERREESGLLKIINYISSIHVFKDITHIDVLYRPSSIISNKKFDSLDKISEENRILYLENENMINNIEDILIEKYKKWYQLLWPDRTPLLTDEFDYSKSRATQYLHAYCVPFIEYLFVMDLMQGSFDCRKSNPSTLESNYPNDYVHKRIAYSEVVRGCKTQWICDDYMLKHPHSNEAIRFKNYQNMNYIEMNWDVCRNMTTNSSKELYLKSKILFDLYTHQWKKFNELIGTEPYFDKFEICKRLPDIQYIITKDFNSNISVYRQVEEK